MNVEDKMTCSVYRVSVGGAGVIGGVGRGFLRPTL